MCASSTTGTLGSEIGISTLVPRPAIPYIRVYQTKEFIISSLNDINTPAELAAFNQQNISKTDKLNDMLNDLGYSDSLAVVASILTNLADYHTYKVHEAIEQDTLDGNLQWCFEEAKLRTALALVLEIE